MEDQKLIKIIEDLKEVRTKTKSKVSDEVLFDIAARIYTSEQIESHRQEHKFIPKGKVDAPHFSNVPATPNQLWLLKDKLHYQGDTSKLTREEASELIDKLKGGKAWKNTKNFKDSN